MGMGYSTGHEYPLDYEENAYSTDEDKWDNVFVGCLMAICLGKDLNHGVTDHSPTSESIEHIDHKFECLVSDESLDRDYDNGGKDS